MTVFTASAEIAVAGFHLAGPPAVLGLLSGLTYGLLAVGLVLVYRTSRIVNFAHGQMGALGVAVMGLLTHSYHIPYYLALIPALGAGAVAAGATEVVVVRRLRNTTRLMSIVATLGVGEFLSQVAQMLNPGTYNANFLPTPPGIPALQLGSLRIDQAYMAMLIFGPLAVLALTVFLRRGRFGLGIRCAATNSESARMAGISVDNMSALAWILAGLLSALTAVLLIPAAGFTSAAAFGPSLLLRALAAGVIARMHSLPVAFAAGIGIGVIEQLLLYNYPQSHGLPDLVFWVLILVALLVQRNVRGREEEKGSWATVSAWRPLPATVAKLPEVRTLRWALVLIVGALMAALPLVVSNAAAITLSTILAFAIVGLSVGIGAGLTGQLSLGQFAVAAVGAVAAFQASRFVPFPVVLIAAAVAGAAASLVIGVPALRLKGLMLTVTTLGFALMASDWGLDQSWALGGGVSPRHPYLFGHSLNTGRSYYYVSLAIFLLALLLTWNARRRALGQALLAIRDNEDNARAFTLRVDRLKIQAFVLAGVVAGLGGAVYGHLLSFADSSSFPAQSSIDAVAMTVIGGMSILLGPLLGALYVIGLPHFLPLDAAGLAATQLGWLILILYLPGGLAEGLHRLRDRYAGWVAGRHGLDLHADQPSQTERRTVGRVAPVAAPRRPVRADGPVLEARNLRKAFRGVVAVQDVSLSVRRGEILGLIGPNGAGKTTTFELLSGFTRADGGTVVFDGADVSAKGPEYRGRRGLIRSFQDAALFPTLTVADTVGLAFEPSLPTGFTRSVLGLPGTEKQRTRQAAELIDLMGLGPFRTRQIGELSTGTRRITELACLIALSPTLLLLDEPSSGVAQRETEQLGILLRQVRSELDLTMLIIEHDIPLIMGLADRVVVMEVGAVIAAGTPQTIRNDPQVIEAYLGTNTTAINRSTANVGVPE